MQLCGGGALPAGPASRWQRVQRGRQRARIPARVGARACPHSIAHPHTSKRVVQEHGAHAAADRSVRAARQPQPDALPACGWSGIN